MFALNDLNTNTDMKLLELELSKRPTKQQRKVNG